MDIQGRGIILQGTRTGGVWNWDVCQFTYEQPKKGEVVAEPQQGALPRPGSEPRKVVPIPAPSDFEMEDEAQVNPAQKGIFARIGDATVRTLAGTTGAALPLLAHVGLKYAMNRTLPTGDQLADLGLSAGILGIVSSHITNEPGQAFNRGVQYGSVAVFVELVSGIGQGETWKAAKGAADKAQTWVADNLKQPLCNWSANGRVGQFLSCAPINSR